MYVILIAVLIVIPGDVKMKTKADYSRERRRGSLHDAEHRMLEGKRGIHIADRGSF